MAKITVFTINDKHYIILREKYVEVVMANKSQDEQFLDCVITGKIKAGK